MVCLCRPSYGSRRRRLADGASSTQNQLLATTPKPVVAFMTGVTCMSRSDQIPT